MARAFIVWSINGEIHASEVRDAGETVIGRSSSANVVIADDTVSRTHARVRPEGDGYVIENLSGVNPTKVNKTSVTAPQQLSDGDHLELGNVQLAFHDLASSVAEPSQTCSSCGRKNAIDAKECWYDGTSLVNAPTVIVERKSAACRLIGDSPETFDLFPGEAILIPSHGAPQVLRSESPDSYGATAVVVRNGVPFIVPSAEDEAPTVNGEALAQGRSLRTGDAIQGAGGRYVVIVR
jgi:predicted component of type VI protein secretion system